MSDIAQPQPAPVAGKQKVLDLIFLDAECHHLDFISDEDRGRLLNDLHERNEYGHGKYGTYLMTFNGRDATTDGKQEILDLIQYARQKQAEKAVEALVNPTKEVAQEWELVNQIYIGAVKIYAKFLEMEKVGK